MLCVVCPHCRELMSTPEETVKEVVCCPKCRKGLQVPPNAPKLPGHLSAGLSEASPLTKGGAYLRAGGAAGAVAAPPLPGGASNRPANAPPTSRGLFTPFLFIVGVLVAGGAIFAVLTYMPKAKRTAVKAPENKKTDDVPDIRPVEMPDPGTDVSAELLHRLYHENTLRADSKFKNKKLTVTGQVDAVATTFVLLQVGNKYSVSKVKCIFSDRHHSEMSKLLRNQRIHVRGTCQGLIDHVLLSDCEFVKK